MKRLINLLILLTLISCSKPELTKTEINAVQQALNFYGGQCNRVIGIKTTNTEKLKYFELEFSKSQLLDYWINNSELPASNIAFLFYSNLDGERSKYNLINVKLNFSNGSSATYSFNESDLSKFIQLSPIMDTISTYLKAEEYGLMSRMFDTNSPEKFTKNYDSTDKLLQTQIQGFITISDSSRKTNPISIISINQYEKGNKLMKVIIDPDSEKILQMNIN